MRMEILDEKTGVCLVDKIWKWPEGGKKYPALCKLIKSLFLIAKSLHAGGLEIISTNHYMEFTHLIFFYRIKFCRF